MKKIILGIWIILTSISMQAQEKKNKNAKFSIQVNGNCDLCKKRIEKAAFEIKGVKSAVWDIESHQLNLIINEDKTTLIAVEQNIAKVGHDTQNIKAEDTVYNNLHYCCKYERQ